MPSFDITYTYDAAGNRLTKTDNQTSEVTTYSYDGANRLLSETDSSGTTNYEHDDDGNRTKKETPSTTTFYEWDQENRLVEVEPAAGTVTLTYNGDGQRVKKETPSETTKFIYDFKRLLQETDGSDETQHLFTQSTDEYGDLVSEFGGGASSYFQYDALGSADALMDADETAMDRYQYQAFGLQDHTSGSSENRFTFVGRQNYYRDSELELYMLGMGNSDGGGRLYDPAVGAFISQDPIEDDVNLYRYVGNNPVNVVDPSGHQKVFDDDLSEEFANTPEDDLRRLEFVVGEDRETIRRNLERRIRRLNELTQEPAGGSPRQVKYSDLIRGAILELKFQRDNLDSLLPLAFEGEGTVLKDKEGNDFCAIILPPVDQLLEEQREWLRNNIRLPSDWRPPDDPPESLEMIEREIDRLTALGRAFFDQETLLRIYDQQIAPSEREEHRRVRELMARAGVCFELPSPTERYCNEDRWKIAKNSVLRRYVYATRRHWLKRRERVYSFYIWIAQFSLNLISNMEDPHVRQMAVAAGEAAMGAGGHSSLPKAKLRPPRPKANRRPGTTGNPAANPGGPAARKPKSLEEVLERGRAKTPTRDIDTRTPDIDAPTSGGGKKVAPPKVPAPKKVPNPHGQHGNPAHQRTVRDLRTKAETEFPNDIIHEGTSFKNQPGTGGLDRRPDVWVEDAVTGKVKKVYEAARREKSGKFVKRERTKKCDYDKLEIPSHFEGVK